MSSGLKIPFLSLICVLFSGGIYAQDIGSVKNSDPVKLSGSISAGLQFYNVNGIDPNRKPISWLFNGNPILSVYGFSLPFTLLMSEQQRDFRQPFNKFGVSPHYKWLKIHAGYRNLVFSPYTLAGHSVLGIGAEINPGKLRIGFMYGRFRKAISEEDTLGIGVTNLVQSYKRTGISAKIGFGTDKNFIDLILLKAKDDESSLSGTAHSASLLPEENGVLSIRTLQTLAKKFTVEAEYAVSLNTADLRNENVNDPQDAMVKNLSFLIPPKTSTTSGNAFEGAVGYQEESFGLKFRFKRISPEFNSMGAYYFVTDMQNLTLEPNVKLAKGKAQISGSIGKQKDNLDEQKNATTNRTIWSARVGVAPGKIYRADVFYSNYEIGQRAGATPIDSLAEISQATMNAGIIQNVNITAGKTMHNLNLMINFQQLKDNNPISTEFSNFKGNVINATYLFSYIPALLNVTAGYNISNFDLGIQKTNISGVTIGLSKSLLKNNLNLGLSYSSFNNRIDDADYNKISSIALVSGYRINKNNRVQLKLFSRNNKAIATSANKFNEIKGDIGYVFTF